MAKKDGADQREARNAARENRQRAERNIYSKKRASLGLTIPEYKRFSRYLELLPPGLFLDVSKSKEAESAALLYAKSAPSPRTKLGNQIQKGLAAGSPSVKLPDDPFKGFRDPEPKVTAAPPEKSWESLRAKLEARGLAVPKTGPGQRDTLRRMAVDEGLAASIPGHGRTYRIDAPVVDSNIQKDPTAKEIRLANRSAAPDLDHLKRENAIPATPPKPNAEPRDDISDAARAYADQHAKPGTRGHVKAMEEVLSGNTAAVEKRTYDASGQKRVPAGSPQGGEWTR